MSDDENEEEIIQPKPEDQNEGNSGFKQWISCLQGHVGMIRCVSAAISTVLDSTLDQKMQADDEMGDFEDCSDDEDEQEEQLQNLWKSINGY